MAGFGGVHVFVATAAANRARRRPWGNTAMKRSLARAVAAAILIGVLGCGVAGALAQDKRAIVEQRRAAMKAQGAAMGGVKR
jgi:uncharacterized membrane protein